MNISTRQLTIIMVVVVFPLSAFFLSDMANQWVAHALHSPPSFEVPPPHTSLGARVPAPNTTSLSDIINGPLFPPSPENSAIPSPRVKFQNNDLGLRLVGTMLGEGSLSPTAIIQEGEKKKQRLYKLGDLVAGQATLIRIGRNEIVLQGIRTGSHLHLRLNGGTQTTGMSDVGKDRLFSKIRDRDGTKQRMVLERREVEERFNNLPQLLTQAQVAPAFNHGELEGYMLLSIEHGSFYEKLGFLDHDILTRINGIGLQDPTQFVQLLAQLRLEDTIAVDMVRDGKPLTMEYLIR